MLVTVSSCNLLVPSGSPLNFGASVVASRSATITWNPPQADLQNGIIIRYLINVTVVETGQFFQLTSSTTSLTISTLVPFRNYICIIAAVTSVGVGPFSARFTLTTPQDGECHTKSGHYQRIMYIDLKLLPPACLQPGY